MRPIDADKLSTNDSCDMNMISTAMFGGTEVHIVPVEYVGTAYMSRRRRHKKRRTDKKWLKRYGYVQRYRDDKVLMVNGCFWMTRNTYAKVLEKEMGKRVRCLTWMECLKMMRMVSRNEQKKETDNQNLL